MTEKPSDGKSSGRENQRVLFSDRFIDRIPPPQSKRTYYTDASTRGLLLTVHPSGRKVFSLYRKLNGRPQRILLGTFPDLDVTHARTKAAEMNEALARGQTTVAIQKLTFGELFDAYMEKYAKPRKRTWLDDQEQFDRYLKEWRSVKVSAIRRSDVAALHARIGAKAPYAANRVLAMVRCVFNRAADLGWELENPVKGIRRFHEQTRERFLAAVEMPNFFEAVLNEPNEVIRDLILVLIFTGARRGNVQAMRWDQIDFARCVWTIPVTKSGSPLTVSLTREAQKVLQARRESVPEACPWVFPGFGQTGHITEVKATWKNVLKRAGIRNLRIHDLRRTLGSWQAATGASLPIIGRALGHKTPQATAVYARLDVDPVRRSLETATRAMLTAAAKTPKPTKQALTKEA